MKDTDGNPAKIFGRRDINKGLIILFIGLLLTIGSILIAISTGQKLFYIFTGLIFIGIIQILRGIGQQFPSKDEIQGARYKLNIEKYGVEEPEKTWDCPYCRSINPNTTFVCLNCGKRL